MRAKRAIQVIGCHAEGEIGDVIVGGVLPPPGATMYETGTGTSARMAVLEARGLMKVGDTMTHASIIGSQFHGRIEALTTVGDRRAILPSIRGQAWITGTDNYLLDPTDPYPKGYVLSDTWGLSTIMTQ